MSDEREAKGRVLMVDDESALLEVWSEILADAGWEVDTASNGSKSTSMRSTASWAT